jgi:hypothetical protein
MGNIQIWFLGIQNLQADGMTYTGTTRTCRTILPDDTLTALAQGVTGGMKIQIAITDSTFDAITRTFPISGTQGPPGGMYTEQPQLGGLGLVNGSGYLNLMMPMAWPPDCAMMGSTCNSVGSFMASDLQDDDGDGNPGITATPNGTSPYVLPPTALVGGNSSDKVYIVLRQELQLTGTRSADGKTTTGTAVLSLFDNHVVGCHTTVPANCTSDEASFVDMNRTKYTTQANYMQTNPPAISPSNQVMGTFTSQQISNGAACSDVRSAVP